VHARERQTSSPQFQLPLPTQSCTRADGHLVQELRFSVPVTQAKSEKESLVRLFRQCVFDFGAISHNGTWRRALRPVAQESDNFVTGKNMAIMLCTADTTNVDITGSQRRNMRTDQRTGSFE
jgi:hypothetical protein